MREIGELGLLMQVKINTSANFLEFSIDSDVLIVKKFPASA